MTVTPQSLADKAVRLRAETKTPLTYGELVGDELTDEEVARLHLNLDEYQTAVNAVVKAIGDEWVRRWKARGEKGLEVDGFWVATELGTKWEKCVDSFGLLDWLSKNPQMVHVVLNPNEVKKGSLPPAVRSTFYEQGRTVKPHHERKPVSVPFEVIEDNRKKKELKA